MTQTNTSERSQTKIAAAPSAASTAAAAPNAAATPNVAAAAAPDAAAAPNAAAARTAAAAPTAAPRGIRRLAERQTTDRDALFELLDTELVGHLAAVVDGTPVVVPMGYARDGEHLLVHGSTGGGFALRAAASGATVAFAVTALDGLVFARSLFDSSMNYRSAVVYGVLEPVDGDRADAALLALSEHLMPGRSAEVRAMTRKETAATRVLRLALDDVVMKTRAAGASEGLDDGEDHTVWAGVVPLERTWGVPEPSPLTPAGTPTPSSVVALTTRSRPEHRLL